MRKEEDRGHEKFETINTVVEVIAGIIRRKQAEKDKKEYESHLMQSSKLAALGQMAAGVAHELNNPLTIIMGNAQYLVERGAAGNGTAKVFEEINGAAQRCSKIISSLLDFSRKKELKFQECFLSDLIEDVLHFAGNETKNNNIKIIKEYNPNLPRVNVSYSHMEQVFLNIVINAIQSMEHGGELSIKTDFSSDKNGVDISFTDHGAGIPADNISKIFNPFFTTKPKGTGLGLAISFGIIKQHGGDINVTSPGAGKGSVFTVTLPLNIIGRK
jgi:two-component system NtrC family sensor kinase